MRLLAALWTASLLATICFALPARAQDDSEEPMARAPACQGYKCTKPAWLEQFEFGLAAVAYGGVSLMDKPADKAVQPGGNVLVPYGGFGGFGPGGGLTLDARFMEFVGIEWGVFFTSDYAYTDINDVKIEITQSAVHMPLMLKLTLPSGPVRPFLAGGLEFAFPDAPTTSTMFGNVAAHASDYTLWAFALGFEIRTPVGPVDLRFPLTFRGAVNMDDHPAARDRMDLKKLPTLDYLSEWQYHIAATFGAAVYY